MLHQKNINITYIYQLLVHSPNRILIYIYMYDNMCIYVRHVQAFQGDFASR